MITRLGAPRDCVKDKDYLNRPTEAESFNDTLNSARNLIIMTSCLLSVVTQRAITFAVVL